MKGVWRIARIAGIDLNLHWSFSLIGLWLIFQGTVGGREIETLFFLALALVLLFGCVALHELGHAWVALRLNVTVKSVTLLPIGGLAQIQAVPQRPLHELLIAAAGPLVNLILTGGVVFWLLLVDPNLLAGFLNTPRVMVEAVFFHHPFWEQSLSGFLAFLLLTNVILFAFNLIPTFPMDGGRILRALLACFWPYPRATRVAIGLGQLFAIGLIGLAMWLHSFILLFTALFVFCAGLPVLVKQRTSIES